jgi:hypothetical protein
MIMSETQAPSQAALTNAIEACLANGQRLLDERYDLEFRDPVAKRIHGALNFNMRIV